MLWLVTFCCQEVKESGKTVAKSCAKDRVLKACVHKNRTPILHATVTTQREFLSFAVLPRIATPTQVPIHHFKPDLPFL
jgi:hypothetical protein